MLKNIIVYIIAVIGMSVLMFACGDEDEPKNNSKQEQQSFKNNSDQGASKIPLKSSELAKQILPSNIKEAAQLNEVFSKDWTNNGLLYTEGQDASCSTGDEKSIYIRYVSHYPDNPKDAETFLFTDVKIPPTAEKGFKKKTPLITEKVLRGQFEWQRNHYKLWWNGKKQKSEAELEKDKELIRSLQEKHEALSEDYTEALESVVNSGVGVAAVLDGPEARALAAFGIEMQEQTKLIYADSGVISLNEKVYDRIEVQNPPPIKSFRYDNVEKRGDFFKVASLKYRKKEIKQYYENLDEDTRGELTNEVLDVLQPLQDLGESIVDAGQKTILGYTCQMKAVPDWDSETCSHDFPGLGKIMLKTRVSKRVTEAVYIKENPCVPDSQFLPPSDVTF